jgi:chromosome partitioning protein
MALIITLAHQKGGVGKSTLSLNLYGYFSQNGYKCVLVDIDPQGSITSLLQVFDESGSVELIERTSFKSYAELEEKIAGFDIVLIDTPPYLSKELYECLAISHFVLIPCKASPFDALAVVQTLDFITEEKKKNSLLSSAIVLTMTVANTTLPQQIRESLQKHGVPILNTEIRNRVAYARSLLFAGHVVNDEAKSAKEEIANLANEIIKLLSKKF